MIKQSAESHHIRLRHVCDVNPPVPELRALFPNEEVTFLPLECVWDRLDLSNTISVNQAFGGFTEFREGDVLVPKITPTFEAARSSVAAGLTNGVGFGTTELHVLRPHADALNARFLMFLTKSRMFLEHGQAAMYGVAGQKRVPEEFIKDFPVPRFRTSTQRAIVRFLDEETTKTENLIAKKKQLIDAHHRAFDALMDHTIKPLDQPQRPLKRVAGAITVGVVVNPSTYVDPMGSVMFFRGVDVRSFELNVGTAQRISHESNEFLAKSKLSAGDVVSVRVGEPGISAVVPPGAGGSNCASLLITKKGRDIDSDYLCFVFNSPYGRSQFRALANGAAQLQVNATDAVNFSVPVPPIDEQRAIAAHLNAERLRVKDLERALNSQIALLYEYRSTLITAAVTGQIDVRSAA